MIKIERREESSGNVFADLNIPKPSLYLAKAQLASQICAAFEERNSHGQSNDINIQSYQGFCLRSRT